MMVAPEKVINNIYIPFHPRIENLLSHLMFVLHALNVLNDLNMTRVMQHCNGWVLGSREDLWTRDP